MVVVCKHFDSLARTPTWRPKPLRRYFAVCVVRLLIGYNGSGRYGGYTTTENRNGVNSV
jgi:hypothetical protein